MSAIIVLVLFSIRFIRWHFFEFFSKLHILLAMVVGASLWYHVPRSDYQRTTSYLVVFYSIWGLSVILRLALVVYRSIKWHTDRISGEPQVLCKGEVLDNISNGMRISVHRSLHFQACPMYLQSLEPRSSLRTKCDTSLYLFPLF
jgi:hypothetical protein